MRLSGKKKKLRNWRLRIGDFRSHEEAYHMQRLLMDAFPAYRKEMYIVREEVKIPLN